MTIQNLVPTSLVSFNPAMGVESSLGSLDQQEADLSLDNLGHQMMTIGSSLGNLDQKNGQEGMTIGTAWEPSVEQTTRMSFGKTKPKKRVTFDEATLTAYNKQRQNNRKQHKGSHPESSQLEQLGLNKKNKERMGEQDELPEDRWCKTTLVCWNLVQQEHQRKKQQQSATALEKNLEHKRCIDNNSLDSEDESLGSLESALLQKLSLAQ